MKEELFNMPELHPEELLENKLNLLQNTIFRAVD
jgi:hypothetical protein